MENQEGCLFIKNNNFNVEISFLVDIKEMQFTIKDLGIVIENKLEVSKGSFSYLESGSIQLGLGSGGSNKVSGTSMASAVGLKFGQELKNNNS